MTVTVIHGSPRKGNTYKAARIFMDEMSKRGGVDFTEFFMPGNMPEFCLGCNACFNRGYESCPHSAYTLPVFEAMIKADALIFTSPVFVLQAASTMKNFLEHFAHMFLVHSPREEMFSKKAMIISTTAGAGTRAALRTVATSVRYWGVNRVYKLGFALWSGDIEAMNPARRSKLEARLKSVASKFYGEVASGGKRRPYLHTWIMFRVSRRMLGIPARAETADVTYWREKGWLEKTPF